MSAGGHRGALLQSCTPKCPPATSMSVAIRPPCRAPEVLTTCGLTGIVIANSPLCVPGRIPIWSNNSASVGGGDLHRVVVAQRADAEVVQMCRIDGANRSIRPPANAIGGRPRWSA